MNINNYRPISLLIYVNKILEKALHSRINEYLNEVNFLSANQFGFKKYHSTEYAILSVL